MGRRCEWGVGVGCGWGVGVGGVWMGRGVWEEIKSQKQQEKKLSHTKESHKPSSRFFKRNLAARKRVG